jgi:hypothetical protein
VKRFVLKALALAAVLLPLQLWTGDLLDVGPFPARQRLDEHLKARVDVLLLGDSVATFVRPDDRDKRPLDRLLAERLPGAKVGLVGGNAHFMDVHLAFVEHAFASGARPRAVVVPVNLRSFSPLWDLHPGLQHLKERLRLRWGDTWGLGLFRPVEAYRLYERGPASEKEWLESPAYRGTRRVGTVDALLNGRGDQASVPPLTRLFTLTYMQDVDPGHRHLRALRRLVELCRREGVPVLAYSTPVDVQSGLRWVGPEFREQVRRNALTVRRAVEESGARLLDLTPMLPADVFAWGPVPNEHLSEQGRARLADELARELASRLKF